MSESTGRRSFLASVGTGWTLFTAASVAGLGMCVRFLFPNDTFEPATKFKVGYPKDFAASADGSVDKRFKTRGVWIVRRLDGFFVLSTVCTHLGCTHGTRVGAPAASVGFYERPTRQGGAHAHRHAATPS